MNPDLMDPKLCICGEWIDEDQEFCTPECENDFYEVQALAHYEGQQVMASPAFTILPLLCWVARPL